MAESRIALVSRHIILPGAHHPVYGLILIQGERIVDVILADDSIPVFVTQTFALVDKYASWHPNDLENFYISPGLIDVNVRANSSWESLETRTKAAISGGVTMILEEPSLYRMPPTDGPLYCDVGSVCLLECDTPPAPDPDVFALKAYMYPPSAYVGGVSTSVRSLMETAAKLELPLFLDATLPSPRMLYLGSPLHNKPLQERFQDLDSDETQFFAAVFPDIIESSSSSSGSEPDEFDLYEGPDRTVSNIDGYHYQRKSTVSKAFESSVIDEGPELQHTRKKQAMSFSRSNTLFSIKRQSSLPRLNTIYDDLDKRIKRNRGNIENLSTLEMESYEFTIDESQADSKQRKRSHSMQLNQFELIITENSSSESHSRDASPEHLKPPPTEPEPQNSYKERVKLTRPMGLAIGKSPKRSPQAQAKDRNYMINLANSPGGWETKGVDVIVKNLKVSDSQKAPCRVHLVNLSCAEAVNRVRMVKEYSELLTCETCPHYLFFAAEDVAAGDTRLKSLPPIRDKANCDLLWELLLVKVIDIISSNHTAIAKELKFQDLGSFKKALGGIECLGYTLQAVWTRLKERFVSNLERYLTRLAKWMSLGPAKLINVARHRGSIEKGKFADILIWSPYGQSRTANCGRDSALSPYSDVCLDGTIHRVYLRGKIAYNEGSFTPVGRRVLRTDFLK